MIAAARQHGSVCASCRLRASIVTKQIARSRRTTFQPPSRLLTTSPAWRYPRSRRRSNVVPEQEIVDVAPKQPLSVEDAVRHAREEYGDALPEGELTEEQYKVYERLFGKPFKADERDEVGGGLDAQGVDEGGVKVLREGPDGALEEIEFELEDELEEGREEMVMSDELDFDDDARLAGDIQDSMSGKAAEEVEVEEEDEPAQRTHPLTLANRFGPSPNTVYLPKAAFVDPATLLLSGMPPVHLSEAAHRVFGGTGLPYSTSTPAIGKTMQQKPIALDAYQAGMSDIEGDVYMAALMPAIYASVTSVLAETRKRLGTAWAEDLVRKAGAGELRVLDAGGAGAGILAVREVLRAEWERMHEGSSDSPMGLAEADGRLGGASASPPLGTATVLTGSDVLRRRASQLLDNTTFIPRLPDYVHAENAPHKGKFDIIIAPHTLWPLREDYIRRTHTQNLWSMLSTDGGVLLLLEKGIARGFELVAGARELLLDTRISSPESRAQNLDIDDPPEPYVAWEGADEPEPLTRTKDKGMIIAPCTNHAGCPMYTQKGIVKGRKDICHFEQRYIRPAFLQKILRARDKNHEDVRFSYLAVMRGRDLREEQADAGVLEQREGGGSLRGIVQGKEATDRAFEGYDTRPLASANASASASSLDATAEAATPPPPHSLTLPRAILPPIKRRGHVIIDLCTPAGTLERWTVPRSFSRQAYRDARKSQWGDLWALGAKTRVLRTVRGPKTRKADLDVKGKRKEREGEHVAGAGVGLDEYGRLTTGHGASMVGEGGKMRKGKKVKGIRDKRDKKGTRPVEE
ncbi:hypothetical protein LTR36_005568 [Oleoguttula mirabilis]|uniref:Uncharacterized protein n=1 Tax=Oleoguttula mirabilis TaxID=1507867 RepID=A0AAV9JEI1_9PEZI|nr:hypothetical protein LTR36_005568 [Oleoguttula mirabilis]